MSSNINPYNIDGTFPVAGQDNSSQGFRDNFTNIKNNFAFAQNEITDLQTKSILTAALNGQTINNDMAGTQIVRPQLRAWTQAYLDLGVIGETNVAQLDFNIATFYKCTAGDDIRLNLVNWPNVSGSGALGYGSLRVWIVIQDPSYTITLPSSVTIGVNDITGYNPNTRAITVDRVGNYIFDFSSVDGGANYFIEDVMRNRRIVRGDSQVLGNLTVSGNTFIANTYVPTSSNSSGNVGQFSYDSTHFYVCTGPNNWMRANLSSF
jgi:hypothetical protein